MAVSILLNGCLGRMGRTIAEVAAEREFRIAGTVDLQDDPAEYIESCDVVVDFSAPHATPRLADLSVEYGKGMVIGTTGHNDEEGERIRSAARSIPVVWAGNFSVGVNVVFYLIGRAATLLGENFNPEVVEMHHRNKVDAPSGTAERLVEILAQARNLRKDQERHGRRGHTGIRPNDEIGVHALRGGDVVGDHTVHFAGEGERIEITHRASDRRVFAHGALDAVSWVMGKEPGLYRMEDVLGLG